MEQYYDVFVRNWYKWEHTSFGRRKVPGPGRKTYLQHHVTWTDAREICRQYNDRHEPGPLSRKAEFAQAR